MIVEAITYEKDSTGYHVYMLKLDLGNRYELVEQPEDVNLALPNDTGRLGHSTKFISNKLNVILK